MHGCQVGQSQTCSQHLWDTARLETSGLLPKESQTWDRGELSIHGCREGFGLERSHTGSKRVGVDEKATLVHMQQRQQQPSECR